MQAAIAKALEYAAPSYTAGELKSAQTALTELMETVAADGIDLEAEVSRKERDPSVANLYRLFQIVSATTSYSSLPESELIIELFSIAILNGYERSRAAYLPRVALAEEKAGATAIEEATQSKAAALADNLERRPDDLSDLSDTSSRRARKLVAELRRAPDTDTYIPSEANTMIKALMTPEELATYKANQRFLASSRESHEIV
jgi:hypothetical protein